MTGTPTRRRPTRLAEKGPTCAAAKRRQKRHRLLDIALAAPGLVVTAPLLGAGVLIARLTSGGTGLFQQERLGLRGKPFTVYKLRTMRADADASSTSTAAHDPRLTRAGVWLRRTKIDELPQLWCVLRGDMSFVGPRPDVPAVIDSIPPNERAVVLSVRPGITGLATLYFRDEEEILAAVDNPDAFSLEELLRVKTLLNTRWIKHDSVANRIRLILLTVWPRAEAFAGFVDDLVPELTTDPDVDSINRLRVQSPD